MKPARVEVTRPDKLLWPAIGITKQAYVDYLNAVSPSHAPVAARPAALADPSPRRRGRTALLPEEHALARAEVDQDRHDPGAERRRDVAYTVCNDTASLTWLGNQAALEFHPAPLRRDKLERPDLLVADIDPPGDAFDAAVEVALLVLEDPRRPGARDAGQDDGRQGPAHRGADRAARDAERLRHAASRLAEIATERRPDLVTAEFRKAKRGGRVMLDPSRNGPGATLVAPYSPRIRPDGAVSFPVLPKDLRKITPATSRSRQRRSS